MSEVNVPLLRKAVEWAESEWAKGVEHSRWEQGMWYTTPEKQENARMALKSYPWVQDSGFHFRAAAKAPECGTCYCIAGYLIHQVEGIAEGDKVFYTSQGAQMLGITDDQAELLFHAYNSIEDVRRIAEEIAGERL